MRLEPEGLLVDSYHPGEGPHVHDVLAPNRRIPLGEVRPERVERILVQHLQEHGRIRFARLVQELESLGD